MQRQFEDAASEAAALRRDVRTKDGEAAALRRVPAQMSAQLTLRPARL